jgi:hypothetical protein
MMDLELQEEEEEEVSVRFIFGAYASNMMPGPLRITLNARNAVLWRLNTVGC